MNSTIDILTGRRMLSKAGTSLGLTAVRRLALVTIVLIPLVILGLNAWFWLESHLPDRVYWKGALIFLALIEIAYLSAVTAAAVGTMIVGWLVLRARRSRRHTRGASQGLLLCVSILVGALLAEGTAAAWQYRAHRFSAVPAGGLRRDQRSGDDSRFPTPAADFPLRTDFADPPGDNTIDLVVLGESSAEGVPFGNWLSIASILEWKLSRAIPGRPIRSRVLARSGDTLEWQHRELANLRRRPDILIVYCGHNEFSSRLAASRELDHYFDERLPSAWDILVEETERRSPLCGLIEETEEKCRIALPPSGGRRRLVDVPVYTTTEFTTLLVDFQRRLERIVAYAEQVGALPILILPAANDARFEPNRSYLPATTSHDEREAFHNNFLAARGAETTAPDQAITRYRALLARQPGFAETSFRLAQLLERNGAWDEAYRHYVDARDHDGYPIRCPSEFQDSYRDVASRHNCILIDTQSYFHAIGRHGLLDDELFQDGMHPSLRGQIAVAQRVLQELHSRGAFGWPRNSPVPLVDPAECVARFRMDRAAWRFICLWTINFNNLAGPLRYDPGQRRHQKQLYAEAADRIAAGEAPESLGLANLGTPAPVSIAPSGGGNSPEE
jgi:hypothetical protein